MALGLTRDETTRLVTSGSGHAVSAFEAIDLGERFEVDRPREPGPR